METPYTMSNTAVRTIALAAAFALGQAACSKAPAPPEPAAAPPDPPHAELAKQAAVGWTGDLDGMLERRLVRVLCPASPMYYSISPDGESGSTYEIFRAFEATLN